MATTGLSHLRKRVARRIDTLPAEVLPEVADFLDRLQSKQNEAQSAVRASERPDGEGKLERENAAFLKMRDKLAEQYPEEYVAIHEGQVIDHDADLRSLYVRVYSSPGRTQVLMKRVTGEIQPEILLRSPWRLEPMDA